VSEFLGIIPYRNRKLLKVILAEIIALAGNRLASCARGVMSHVMLETNQHSPGLLSVAGRLARTGVGAIQTRIELFAVEWQEERARLMGTVFWAATFILLGVLAVLLFTATIIFLFPQDARVYVAAGFAVLYLLGAIGAWVGLRRILDHQPFAESIDQAKKDRAWLESLS